MGREYLAEFGLASTDMTDLGPFWLSLRVASMATLLIVALGMPLALLLARTRFPGKSLVAGILVLPLVLPPSVMGFYLLQLLGRQSIVGYWLEHTLGITLVFHWSGAVVASAVAAFPLFLLPARGAFEAIDPALEDVARLLGRNELSVFLLGDVAAGPPRAGGGHGAGFRTGLGRFRSNLDGGGQHPGSDANGGAGDLRRSSGQRHTSCRLADIVDLGGIDSRAHGRPAHPPGAGAYAVSEPGSEFLEARVVHRIHESLTVDVVARVWAARPASSSDRRGPERRPCSG